MKNQKMSKQVDTIVRAVARDKGELHAVEILEQLPQVISGVRIDRDEILRCVEKECEKTGNSPLNALLKLFGLNITRKTVQGIGEEIDSLTVAAETEGALASFLRMDPSVMKTGIASMVDGIAALEETHEKKLRTLQDQNEDLRIELDRRTAAQKQSNDDLDSFRRDVAQRVQYMYSLRDASAKDNPLFAQLAELLEDLDMEALWAAEGTELKEAAMFSVLKCDDPSKKSGKPCILYKGSVLIKGLRFIAEKEA